MSPGEGLSESASTSGDSAMNDPETLHAGHGEDKLNNLLATSANSPLTCFSLSSPGVEADDAACCVPEDADEVL